jgi:hypothetical protein
MRFSFNTIFQVNVLHSFYADGKCNDFVFFPLAETAETLRNHQAIVRSAGNNLRAAILADDGPVKARVPLQDKENLLFGMKLNNYAFSNFTNEYPATKKIFLFTNETNVNDPSLAPVPLTKKEIGLAGPVIFHTLITNLAVTLILKSSDGTIISTEKYSAGSKDKVHAFDKQNLAPGLYTVTEDTGATTDYTYYSDRDLLSETVFGIIRIVNQPAFNFTYDGKPIYTISFTAKNSSWRYYVVARSLSGADINALNIFDAGRTGLNVIGFTRTYPVPANDTTAPLLANDLSKVTLFTSNNPLVWQQTPRQRIELRKSGTTLLSDLPNPDIQSPETKMYIVI